MLIIVGRAVCQLFLKKTLTPEAKAENIIQTQRKGNIPN
jgi:hypothetical protein